MASPQATLALAAALLGLTGCFGRLTPAGATVAGFKQPVLLGPVDRIGMTEPLATTRFGEYEAVSKAAFSRSTSTSGNYQYTVERETLDETEPYTHAITAVQGRGPGSDIRLTMLKARSFGYIAGISNKVVLEGDAVAVGEGK